jgi:hypothetical protein
METLQCCFAAIPEKPYSTMSVNWFKEADITKDVLEDFEISSTILSMKESRKGSGREEVV